MMRNLQKSLEATEKNIKCTKRLIYDNDDAIKLKRSLLTRLHNDLDDKSLNSFIDRSSSSKEFILLFNLS